MRTSVRRLVAAGAGALIGVAAAGRKTAPGRALRHGVDRVGRELRHTEDRLAGLRYRLAGGRPDPNVSDDILVDRIRSSLGPLEKDLDVPRVHVTAHDHVAMLHGEVRTELEAEQIERAVAHVSGVAGVESYLHIGLGIGATPPSVGRAEAAHTPSAALRRLLDAIHESGVPPEHAQVVLRTVLATFAARIPSDERDQLFAHLPSDVRRLASLPRHHGATTRLRTVEELMTPIAAMYEITPDASEALARSVLGCLRQLVPEEADDVAAVLPVGLRELWTAPDR